MMFWLQSPSDEKSVSGQARLWLPEAGIGLDVWSGAYTGVEGEWLRFYDAQGHWCARPVEQERQKAERLAERLRALGIDPDTL